MADPAFRIDMEDRGDIVIRLRSGFLSREKVSKFLDYLTLESIREKSTLTEGRRRSSRTR